MSTRAVMPTLVAENAAPRNACTYERSGKSQAPTPQPSANGAITPTLATTNDDSPTFSICCTVDSSPTSNSSTITPSRASMSMAASVFIGSTARSPPAACCRSTCLRRVLQYGRLTKSDRRVPADFGDHQNQGERRSQVRNRVDMHPTRISRV